MIFSFQDLVFLRTAHGLAAAGVTSRRIRAALSHLRAGLPDGRPLTAVRIAVEGSRVVVEDGARRWRPESGQILFDFGVGGSRAQGRAHGAARVSRGAGGRSGVLGRRLVRMGLRARAVVAAEARKAYEQALALDDGHAQAHVNLGRLLHEAGDAAAAAPHYEAALRTRPDDGTAAFNLGVALEDLGRIPEALLAYESCRPGRPRQRRRPLQRRGPGGEAGQPAAALRHLRTYRKLTRDA